MSNIWIIAELAGDGSLARISAEVATLARNLAVASGREAVGLVIAADPTPAAKELATYLPRILTIEDADAGGHAWSAIAADHAAGLLADEPDALVLLGSGPDGRDTAGALSALTSLGVLVNATAVGWEQGGPTVEMSAFGGKLVTTSTFTTPGGIITVRPNAVTAAAGEEAGAIEKATAGGEARLPRVALGDHVAEASAAAPIEEARIIVSGGRGIGGPDGFGLVEELASALGGAVGATRAAVDSGWIPYAQQIGQTGKIVKPQLYLALGISGAIQHKVGMQTAETIIAVNRDPDAPIGEFADLMVVGDLFAVVPALLAELRARGG